MKNANESFTDFLLREIYAIKVDENSIGIPVLIKYFTKKEEPNKKLWFVTYADGEYMSAVDGCFINKPFKIYDDQEYSEEQLNKIENWKREFTFETAELAYKAYTKFYNSKMTIKPSK